MEHLNEFRMLCDSPESTEQLLGLTVGDLDDNGDDNVMLQFKINFLIYQVNI